MNIVVFLMEDLIAVQSQVKTEERFQFTVNDYEHTQREAVAMGVIKHLNSQLNIKLVNPQVQC